MAKSKYSFKGDVLHFCNQLASRIRIIIMVVGMFLVYIISKITGQIFMKLKHFNVDRYRYFLGKSSSHKKCVSKNKMASILIFHVYPAGVLARLVPTC